LSTEDTSTSSFEDILGRLEQAIAQLAEGTAPLDELVLAHQNAVRLLAEAELRLEAVKDRSEQLTRLLAQ
jgi:exodeoxyribonuclease VII small subunit